MRAPAEAVRERVNEDTLAEALYEGYRKGHQRANEFRPRWEDLKPETRVIWGSAVRDALPAITEGVIQALEAEGYTLARIRDVKLGGEDVTRLALPAGRIEAPAPATLSWTGDGIKLMERIAMETGRLEGMASMLELLGPEVDAGKLVVEMREMAERLRGDEVRPAPETY